MNQLTYQSQNQHFFNVNTNRVLALIKKHISHTGIHIIPLPTFLSALATYMHIRACAVQAPPGDQDVFWREEHSSPGMLAVCHALP
jgi:hypothetical protein